MASYGTPTSPRVVEKAGEPMLNLHKSGRHDYWRRTVCLVVVALAFPVVLAGCTQTLLKFGAPLKLDQLDTLKLGDSTKTDVLLAVGQPQGEGVVRLPANRTPRTIWSYDYTETKLGLEWTISARVTGLRVLLVFFDQDKYDGHLWVSSMPEIQKAQ